MNFRQCHGVSLLPANFRGNLEIFKHSLKCGAEKVLFILGEAWILRGNWIFLLIKLLFHTANYCNCNSPQSVKNVFVLIKKVKWNGFIQIIICFKWSLPVTLVFNQTIRVATRSEFSDFVDFVRISEISQDNYVK